MIPKSLKGFIRNTLIINDRSIIIVITQSQTAGWAPLTPSFRLLLQNENARWIASGPTHTGGKHRHLSQPF